MLLDLTRDVIRSVARFRLCAHTLRIETVTWTHNTSPTCDLCNAQDVQDEHTSFSIAPIYMCSLSEGLVLPYYLPPAKLPSFGGYSLETLPYLIFRRLKQCVCFSGLGKQYT